MCRHVARLPTMFHERSSARQCRAKVTSGCLARFRAGRRLGRSSASQAVLLVAAPDKRCKGEREGAGRGHRRLTAGRPDPCCVAGKSVLIVVVVVGGGASCCCKRREAFSHGDAPEQVVDTPGGGGRAASAGAGAARRAPRAARRRCQTCMVACPRRPCAAATAPHHARREGARSGMLGPACTLNLPYNSTLRAPQGEKLQRILKNRGSFTSFQLALPPPATRVCTLYEHACVGAAVLGSPCSPFALRRGRQDPRLTTGMGSSYRVWNRHGQQHEPIHKRSV